MVPIERDFNGNALNDLREIPCGILRWQHTEFSAAGWGQALNGPSKDNVGIGINSNIGWLPGVHGC